MEREFAERVREARRRQGLSLEALADRSGVSRATLSKIERGDRNPSLHAAVQIAEGLRTPLGELIGQSPSASVTIVRHGTAQRLVDETTKIARESLLAVRRGTELVRYTLPAQASTELFPAHEVGAREGFFVLAGQVRITSGEATVDLAAGDAAVTPGDREHRISNTGDAEASLLLILTRPEWSDSPTSPAGVHMRF